MWRIHGTARLRKQALVRRLPELLEGYRGAAREAGRLTGAGGERLETLADALQASAVS